MSASSKMRGGVATETEPITYNVMSGPQDKEHIREGILKVIREKLRNDIGAANAVLVKANAENITSDESPITLNEFEEFMVKARTSS